MYHHICWRCAWNNLLNSKTICPSGNSCRNRWLWIINAHLWRKTGSMLFVRKAVMKRKNLGVCIAPPKHRWFMEEQSRRSWLDICCSLNRLPYVVPQNGWRNEFIICHEGSVILCSSLWMVNGLIALSISGCERRLIITFTIRQLCTTKWIYLELIKSRPTRLTLARTPTISCLWGKRIRGKFHYLA